MSAGAQVGACLRALSTAVWTLAIGAQQTSRPLPAIPHSSGIVRRTGVA